MDGPYAVASLIAGAHPALRALLAMPHLRQATTLARALLSVRLLPTLAFTSNDVDAYLEADSFAVLVLHLGELDSGRLVAAVRRRSRAPILALGPARRPDERIESLGCEGYAPDTLAPAALARRAVALTRPPPPSWLDTGARQVHAWGPLRLDPSRRSARWHGQSISLTSMQFRLLLVLVQAAGAVVSSVELSRRVWGTDLADDTERVVAHVRRIRKLIEPDPAHPRFLLTVRGEGFRLADHDADWMSTPVPYPTVSHPAVPPPTDPRPAVGVPRATAPYALRPISADELQAYPPPPPARAT